MKIKMKKVVNPLTEQPVITLETQEEVNLLFAIFNYVPIIEALDLRGGPWTNLGANLLQKKTASYRIFHDKLDDLFLKSLEKKENNEK